jgi:DivIVA domain-containing protein
MVDELREVEFPLAMRGYDRAAVDAYVERVHRVIAELEISRSPEAAVKHAVAQVSEETRGILERAHEAAEEITARSRSRADDRLQEAEREAAQVRADAEARVRELDADAEAIWAERHRLLEDVRHVADQLAALAEEAEARFPAAHPVDETQALPDETQALPEETQEWAVETNVMEAEEADTIAADPPPPEEGEAAAEDQRGEET